MVRRLLEERFEAWLLAELPASRERVREVRERHPEVGLREHARLMVGDRRRRAAVGGAALGLLGWVGLPAEAALVAAMQMTLIVDIATLCGKNLKSVRARQELWRVFQTARAEAPSAGHFLSSTARRVLSSSALRLAGRAVPLISMTMGAVADQRAMQRAGDAALRAFEDVPKAVRLLRTRQG